MPSSHQGARLMTRFTRAVVVALGLAVVTLGAQTKHWAYEDSSDSVGPAKWGTLPGDEACAHRQAADADQSGRRRGETAGPAESGVWLQAVEPVDDQQRAHRADDLRRGLDARPRGKHGHVDARAIPLPCPKRAHRRRRVVSDGGAPRPRRRRRQAGRRGGRLHQGRQGKRRVGEGVPGSARQVGRQERAGRRE